MLLFFFSLLLVSTANSQVLDSASIDRAFANIDAEILQHQGPFSDYFSSLQNLGQEKISSFYKGDDQLIDTTIQATKWDWAVTDFQRLTLKYYSPFPGGQRALRCVWALLQLPQPDKNIKHSNITKLLNFIEETVSKTQWLDINTHSYKADAQLLKGIISSNVAQVTNVLRAFYLQPEQNYLQLTEAQRALEFAFRYSLFFTRKRNVYKLVTSSEITVVLLIQTGIELLNEAIERLIVGDFLPGTIKI